MGRNETDQEYIINRIIKDPVRGCWNWRLYLDKSGYGQCSPFRGKRKAHQLSYKAFKGPIPPGMCVCHSCDVPDCVNPNHLWLGTKADNTRDKMKKGRYGGGFGMGYYQVPIGQDCHNNRLTKQQVLEIRPKYSTGQYGQRQLARDYNVAVGTISAIVKNRSWRWL